jgi:hypothetical protein
MLRTIVDLDAAQPIEEWHVADAFRYSGSTRSRIAAFERGAFMRGLNQQMDMVRG